MTYAVAQRWYVVRTRPCSEVKAVVNLDRQGFEAYLPRYLKRRRHARKIDTVAAPLFPGYLFVAIDMATQRWRAIGSTYGVAQLVCNGNEPAPVPDEVIEALRGHEDDRGFVSLPARPRFAAGEKVRLLDGALTGCIALFEDMKDNERVSVLLDLLGRKVRVVVDADLVIAA